VWPSNICTARSVSFNNSHFQKSVMRHFIITGRPSRAASSIRSQPTGKSLKAYLSRLPNRVFNWGRKQELKSSSAMAQNPPSQFLSGKAYADGVNPGFMLGFYKDPKSDSELSMLPYDNASYETGVSFRSLSSWTPLLE
jgi:hypothetical protein